MEISEGWRKLTENICGLNRLSSKKIAFEMGLNTLSIADQNSAGIIVTSSTKSLPTSSKKVRSKQPRKRLLKACKTKLFAVAYAAMIGRIETLICLPPKTESFDALQGPGCSCNFAITQLMAFFLYLVDKLWTTVKVYYEQTISKSSGRKTKLLKQRRNVIHYVQLIIQRTVNLVARFM